jgi:FMN phosphatase YigB (HAD superfamily)
MYNEIKCIAFDLFGTVFDISNTPRQEIVDYINHVKQPFWKPLHLPKSWESLPLHPDSYNGIRELSFRYNIVTCSNAPLNLTRKLLARTGLDFFMGITDISVNQVYKPNSLAYLSVCRQHFYEPNQVLMVTGNAGSPDIQGARNVGMKSVMIRQPNCIKDIIELSKELYKDAKD